MKRRILWFVLPLLTACAGSGDEVQHVYVLEDVAPQAVVVQAPRPGVLRVEPTRSGSYDDRGTLVFSRAPGTRGHYAYSLWSELPSQRMGELLFERLVHDKLYSTVLDEEAAGNADQRLVTTLLAFYHDARHPPGEAVIRLRAELYGRGGFRLLARKEFDVRVPLAHYDGAAAAAAFSRAESRLLDQVERWLVGLPAAPRS